MANQASAQLQCLFDLRGRAANGAPVYACTLRGVCHSLLRCQDIGMIELPWNTAEHRKVGRTEQKYIDARDLCDFFHMLERTRLLDLNHNERLAVRRGHI